MKCKRIDGSYICRVSVTPLFDRGSSYKWQTALHHLTDSRPIANASLMRVHRYKNFRPNYQEEMKGIDAMIFNLKVIMFTLLSLAALGCIFAWSFMKIIVPKCESLGVYLGKRLKAKYWLYVLELLFFILIVVFLVLCFNSITFTDSQSVITFLYFIIFIVLILIETSTYREFRVRNNISKSDGIVGWIIQRTIWESYIAKRLLLFVEQLMHTFYLIIPLYLSLIFMVKLEWAEQHYFISLLFLPIYSNFWVYLKPIWKKYYFKMTFNIYEDIFMRRIIIYFLIIIYAIYEIYGKYNQYISNLDKPTFEYLFIYAAVILYIAIDRLLKEIVSDLDKYKKDNNLKVTQDSTV